VPGVGESLPAVTPAPPTIVKFNRYSVLFQALGTIFGAAMFLLFGKALGHVGLLQMLLIIGLGHLVTGAVAYTTSELASNKRIGGGGEYAMVRTTHGAHIGASVGLALFVAQTISITFYAMAVAIGIDPVLTWLTGLAGLGPVDQRYSALAVLFGVLLLSTKGGDVTVKFLFPIVTIIGIAVLSFFAGVLLSDGSISFAAIPWTDSIPDGMGFWPAFALVFPAFTGNTMGIGLSGELADPQREIPWGTKLATLISLIMYSLIAVFLVFAASPIELVNNQLIMASTAVWGPLIYTGLIVASLSSLIGSVVVAPRTLQAMADDGVLPLAKVFRSLWGKKQEPVPALLFSMAIAVWLVFIGDLDLIASFVTMFFLITYMADMSASLLENISNNPSYRPAQRAPWWLSSLGLLLALVAAANIDATIFLISLVFLVGAFFYARHRIPSPNVQTIFQSVLFRIERAAALRLRTVRMLEKNWQPTVLAISETPLDKRPMTRFLDWIGARHGLVNLCEMIPYEGDFSEVVNQREVAQRRLEEYISRRSSHLIPDVILTHDQTSSILDKVQSGGYHSNTVCFAVEAGSTKEVEILEPIYHELMLIRKNVLLLRYGHRLFGNMKNIYIWWSKPENGQLMVILSYILLCQKDWEDAQVTICYVPSDKSHEDETYLKDLVENSRFQIGSLLYKRFEPTAGKDIYQTIIENSQDADLVFMGLSERADLTEYMQHWDTLKADAIFLSSTGDASLQA
jgi:solute carrier family 12 (sodium/potassium/chloride transporter), member 2